jgi:hypothetical protein
MDKRRRGDKMGFAKSAGCAVIIMLGLIFDITTLDKS